MPRPRFEKLAPEKRKAILDAAADEFGEHGFDGASYNRIIAATGVSKGAMYYYFDDKEDLYVTVMVSIIEQFMGVIGDFPDVETPEQYWGAFEDMMRRSMAIWREDPRAAELSRGFQSLRRSGQMGPAMQRVMQEGARWARSLLDKGRSVGAIRVDLSLELLTQLTMTLDAVMDGWLADHWDDLTQEGREGMIDKAHDLFRRLCIPGPVGTPGGDAAWPGASNDPVEEIRK